MFQRSSSKNDVTDNNNKHFVTAFEGDCRTIIELRKHLKLCFLVILARVVSRRRPAQRSEHLRYRMSAMPLSMEVHTEALETVSALPSTLLSVRLFVSLAR